jgi:hypothetical protein
MTYIILGGCWCYIIILNVHDPTEGKIDDVKDSFYEKLECVFDKFPKHNTKILLREFNTRVVNKDIFKPTTGNESLHEIHNHKQVRVVHFSLYKNLTVKSSIFPHYNIYIFTCTSPDGKTNNLSHFDR